MSNEEILKKRWKKTDKILEKYLSKFQELSKSTLDNIEDLFNSLGITYKDIYKRISKNDEKKLKRKINQWKEDELLVSYLLFLIESKSKYTYADMLEILLYGIYMEQHRRIQKYSKEVFNVVAKDIYNQAMTDLGRKTKKFNLTWEIIQSLLWIPTYNKSWDDYLLLLVMTNVQESYRNLLISLQKDKLNKNELDLLLKKQMNRILSINDDKYSGVLNDSSRALANKVYLEPFKDDKSLQVRFIAEVDKKTTKMCLSMDNMIFYVNDWNQFTRYSASDGRIINYKVFGLESGINLPPIANHFHWCRSTITYLTDLDRDYALKGYNLSESEKDSVIRYIGSDSYKLNYYLYKDIELPDEYKEMQEELDYALLKLPNYKGEVYRCVTIGDQEHLNQILAVFDNKDRIGFWKSYTSSSKDLYDKSLELIFKIESKTGKDLSFFNSEGKGEILFARDTKFKLLNISKKYGKIYVELEEV